MLYTSYQFLGNPPFLKWEFGSSLEKPSRIPLWLTPYKIKSKLTHLGSEASKCANLTSSSKRSLEGLSPANRLALRPIDLNCRPNKKLMKNNGRHSGILELIV